MAEQLSGALAVFVKTPGLSPIKTRLAADIGEKKAAAVYEILLQNTAATMRRARRLGAEVFWAVGEKEGADDARWSEFPAMWDGRRRPGRAAEPGVCAAAKAARTGGAGGGGLSGDVGGADCAGFAGGRFQNRGGADDRRRLLSFRRRPPRRPGGLEKCPIQPKRHPDPSPAAFPPNEVEISPTLTDVDDAATLEKSGLKIG